MNKHNLRSRLQKLAYAAAILIFAGAGYFGCSGTKLTPEQMAAKDARAKAVQDSLAELELKKNWSFGYTNYQNKEYQRVPQYFWKVIELDDKKMFKDVYSFLSRTYFELGKPDSGQMVLEEGIKVFPQNEHLHRNLAYVYENKQELDKAISHYETASKLEPNNVNDLKRLGDLYAKTSKVDNAIATYQKLMELDSENQIEYQSKLSALLRTSGNEAAAIESMKQMLANNPNDTNTLFELASYYKRERNLAEAAKYYERLLEINPKDMIVLEDLAQLYRSDDQNRKAIDVYKRILDQKQNDVRALTGMAEAYTEMGQLQTALRFAKDATRADANYGPAHIAVGQVYEKVVDQCQQAASRKGANFDDKLVYQMAHQAYQRATRDQLAKGRAQSLMAALEPVLPTKGDFFMNQNQTKPKAACYSWVN